MRSSKNARGGWRKQAITGIGHLMKKNKITVVMGD